MTEPHDPLRSLDGTGPQGSWSDVVARAQRPADLPVDLVAGGRSRRPLLVAAAVLAVLALAGTIAVATQAGDGNDKAKVVAGPGDELDPPSAIWGRTWQLSRITVDGKEQPVVPAQDGTPVRLDATERGKFTIKVCGTLIGDADLAGARLGIGDLTTDLPECPGPVHFEHGTVGSVLGGDPQIEVRGDGLTLRGDGGAYTTGGSIARVLPAALTFVDASTFDPPSAIWDRTWTATRFVEDGKNRSIERLPEGAGPVEFAFESKEAVIDASDGPGVPGPRVSYQACNSTVVPLALEGERLVAQPGGMATAAGCPTESGEVFVGELFRSGATVEVRGNRAVLRSGVDRIELVDRNGDGGAVDPAAPEAPTAMWGKVWLVESRFDADHPDGLPVVDTSSGGPPTLTAVLESDQPGSAGASLVGRVSVSGCNGAGGAAHLDGDVLVKDGDWPVTLTACTAEGLMKQDAWIEGLLSSRPTIDVRSDRLTLTTGDGRRMELTLLPGGDEPPPGDPATTTTTTDGLVATTAPETTVPDTAASAQPPSTTTSTVPETTVPTEPPANTTTTTVAFGSGDGSADGFFGYEWHVVSLTGEGANREFRGAVVDTRTAGIVTISGCNGAGGAMRLEGDRLVKNGDWAHTAKGCLPTGDGEDLMAQDAWYEAFLTDGPKVAATPDGFGSAIILDTGTATVHLERP